jgi:hypothetical protein
VRRTQRSDSRIGWRGPEQRAPGICLLTPAYH